MYSTKRPFIQNLVFLLVLHFFAIEQSSIFTKSIEKVVFLLRQQFYIPYSKQKPMPFHILWSINLYEAVEKGAPHGQHDTHQGQALFEVEIKIFTFAISSKYFLICLRLGKTVKRNTRQKDLTFHVILRWLCYDLHACNFKLWTPGPHFSQWT